MRWGKSEGGLCFLHCEQRISGVVEVVATGSCCRGCVAP